MDSMAILFFCAVSLPRTLSHPPPYFPNALVFLQSQIRNMAEASRLIGMLGASAGQNANIEKILFAEPTTRKPQAAPRGIQHVFCLLRSSATRASAANHSRTRPVNTASYIKNALAVANC